MVIRCSIHGSCFAHVAFVSEVKMVAAGFYDDCETVQEAEPSQPAYAGRIIAKKWQRIMLCEYQLGTPAMHVPCINLEHQIQ